MDIGGPRQGEDDSPNNSPSLPPKGDPDKKVKKGHSRRPSHPHDIEYLQVCCKCRSNLAYSDPAQKMPMACPMPDCDHISCRRCKVVARSVSGSSAGSRCSS